MVCYAESPLETVQQRLSAEQKNAKHMQNKSRFLTFSQSLNSRWPVASRNFVMAKESFHQQRLPLFSNDLTPSSLTEKKHLIRNQSPSGQPKQQLSYFVYFVKASSSFFLF